MKKTDKIGVFDSGLGGLSVLATLKAYLPNESFIYIGDSKNAPYGLKSKEAVLSHSKDICDALVESGVKAIVIACNTATSAAVNELRELYKVPIIGMEPAIKPALSQSTGKILVFATEMTLREAKFNRLVDQLDKRHQIIKCPASEWVDLVENHFEDRDFVDEQVKAKLDALGCGAVEAVVLGCTHFVFLRSSIEAYFGNKIEIFDGNMGTALQLKNTLMQSGVLMEASNDVSVEIHNTQSEDKVALSKALLASLEKRETLG